MFRDDMADEMSNRNAFRKIFTTDVNLSSKNADGKKLMSMKKTETADSIQGQISFFPSQRNGMSNQVKVEPFSSFTIDVNIFSPSPRLPKRKLSRHYTMSTRPGARLWHLSIIIMDIK